MGYVDASQAAVGQIMPPPYDPRPADLVSLQKMLEGYVDTAEGLAIRAGGIADQVFGTRPESASAGPVTGSNSLASTIERLGRALDGIQSQLNRL